MSDIAEKLGAMHEEDIQLAPSEQPISEAEKDLVREAYERFEIFRQGCVEWHERARKCRKIALLEDEDQDPPGTSPAERAPQLHTLRSTLVNCIADQMDNMPEARMIPERSDLVQVADDLTDIVGHVMERNEYERMHRERVEDFFVTGTSVVQIVWDDDIAGTGSVDGDVALLRWPIEAFYWDPLYDDIQDGRAVFKAAWKTKSWFAEHYPDEAPYVGCGPYQAIPQEPENLSRIGGDEEPIMLLEYWYRTYDAEKRRYAVHMALLGGGALLECSERDRPGGLYAHGMYPFVLDVYTRVEGLPVGNGMLWEFAEMQRYINRYAQYIDANARSASKMRLLVRKDADIANEDLTDWNANVIEGGNIGDQAVRWFQTSPLSNLVNVQMRQFQDDIKMDSGQNQFTRGEGGSGVTAASAITALQEAGGKTARMRTATLHSGFKRIAEHVLWLISQFYDEERVVRLRGVDQTADRDKEVAISQERIYNGDASEEGEKPKKRSRKKGDALPPPPYTVRIQVQRRNPMRIQAENEIILQMYSMAAQGGTPIPLPVIAQMLHFDGKDKILPVLQAADQTMRQMQQLAAQNEQLQVQLQQTQEQAGQQIQQMGKQINNLKNEIAEQTKQALQFSQRNSPGVQPMLPTGSTA